MPQAVSGAVENIFDLTPLQSGLLFHKLLDERSTQYVLQQVIDVAGPLDRATLRAALDALALRHQALRTAIVVPPSSGVPRQVVLRQRTVEFAELPLPGSPGTPDSPEDNGAFEARLAALAAADVARGFDLAKDPLVRVTLVPAGPDRAGLIWSVHHIVVDGWSLPLLFADFARYYTLAASGVTPADLRARAEADAARAPGFGDYLAWLSGRDQAAALDYWDGLLAGYDHVAEIPVVADVTVTRDAGPGGSVGGRPQYQTPRAAVAALPAGASDTSAWAAGVSDTSALVASATVPAAVTDALREIGGPVGVTLPMWLNTAWGLLLQRYTRSHDVVFGQVVSGRDADFNGLDGIVGLLINTLPLRVRTVPGQTGLDLAQAVRDQHLALAAAGHAPLPEVQRRHPAGQRLIQTLVAFENYAGATAQPPLPAGLTMTPRTTREETSYSFTIRASLRPDLVLEALYDPAQYSPAAADRVLRRLVTLLTALAETPNAPADDLDPLDAAERDLVLTRFNDSAVDPLPGASVTELIEHWAAERPDQLAVTSGADALTYAEFNARCNQLAHVLRGLGAGPGDCVGLVARRGVGLIVGQYGIAKAGAAWVPIDPDYPPERVQFILDDLGITLVVTADVTADVRDNVTRSVPPGGAPSANPTLIDVADPAVTSADTTNPAPLAGPEDIVYCIYTSGTTGRPKAVLVRHRNLLNYCTHLYHRFPHAPDTVAAQVTSFTFDAGLCCQGLALAAGRAMHLVADDALLDPARFRADLADHHVTHVLCTPAHFREMDFPPGLVTLCTGGAPATPDLVRRALGFAPQQYANAYGPTEITVVAADWVIEQGEPVPPVIPIGRPIGNAQCYVLDGLRPQGVGMIGELAVGGAGVTAGYHHRPELTAARFVPNPFGPGNLYRTGDLAYWQADGNLVCLGRTDDQVKIRGFRIEPAEVEAVVREAPGVRDAVVLARVNAVGEATLAAFYAPADVPAAAVEARCRAALPGYMVPASITAVAALPLKPSGKVDAAALLALAAPSLAGRAADPGLERTIADAIGAALGLDAGAVPADADFFALGGDSLAAIRVTARLGAAGVAVTVRELFLHRTPAALALALAEGVTRDASSPVTLDGGSPVTADGGSAVTADDGSAASAAAAADTPPDWAALERALAGYEAGLTAAPAGPPRPWTAPMRLSADLGVLASYAVVDLPGRFDAARFEAAWRRLLQEQELLRVTLDAATATMTVHSLPDRLAVPLIALPTDSSDAVAQAIAHVLTDLNPYPDPAALTGRPAHRVTVLVHSLGATVVVPISHLVFDALSHDLLADRLRRLYRDPAAPPVTGPSYRDFAAFLDRVPDVADVTVVAGLNLEAFAAAAETWAGGPGVGPAWGVVTGRAYRSANFAAALGEFLDVVPCWADPAAPDALAAPAAPAAFVRDHNLSIAALLTDTPAAAALPRAAALLRAAWSNRTVPILNAVILSATPRPIPGLAGLEQAPSRIVTLT